MPEKNHKRGLRSNSYRFMESLDSLYARTGTVTLIEEEDEHEDEDEDEGWITIDYAPTALFTSFNFWNSGFAL